MAEVREAVTSSSGNGYDEEYPMRQVFEASRPKSGNSMEHGPWTPTRSWMPCPPRMYRSIGLFPKHSMGMKPLSSPSTRAGGKPRTSAGSDGRTAPWRKSSWTRKWPWSALYGSSTATGGCRIPVPGDAAAGGPGLGPGRRPHRPGQDRERHPRHTRGRAGLSDPGPPLLQGEPPVRHLVLRRLRDLGEMWRRRGFLGDDGSGTAALFTVHHGLPHRGYNSRSYGFEIEIPLRARDDIIWRGALTRTYIERNNGVTGHFGDVELVLELI